ncbi:MAG: CHAT domain-containing protein, partial [Thermosynechococcaceae cyanobacterium]
LDNIPIGFLHDGSQHLLEKYEIATSLGAQLETQRPSTQKPKILFAGASNSPTSQALKLPQLLEVEQEADSISEVFGASRTKALVNQSFTLQNIKEKLPSYSYLHLATHGQFSSNPQDTYLVAWQEKIGVQQLEQLILERTSNRSKGLDLLFLSACQSAKGDSRSELGLAGLATQAGAKNAIATLWQVNSRSTSLLAAGFYQRIAKGQPYAQALQQAQLELMHSKDYKHPYFWAPFVLLGGL